MSFLTEIHGAAEKHGVKPELLAAIVAVESGGRPWVVRYEPQYKYLVDPIQWARKLGLSTPTEEVLQKTSFGLVQIMGGVARELKFKGVLTELLDPVTNLDFGARKLAALGKKHKALTDVIASYNAGSPRRANNQRDYVNPGYVDKVLAKIREYSTQGN